MENPVEARQCMGTPKAAVVPARVVPLSSARRRGGPPQAILHEFEDAMEKAGRVCQLARGREVNGIVECVRKLVSAERLKAQHIILAADRALEELS